jgi:hypothetical protein
LAGVALNDSFPVLPSYDPHRRMPTVCQWEPAFKPASGDRTNHVFLEGNLGLGP